MSEATPEVEGGPPPLAAQPGDALPAGTRLAEFEIRSVLGAGGFGIVYLAWDHALEREVALKEYMPVSLAGRTRDGRVSVRAVSQAETFSLGLRSFVNEARLLARFDHPSLVRVYRFWEDNGTAYMAMPMVQGRTLRQVRQAMPPGSPGEAWCRALLDPLLGALECMHREEVFHRDIAPDNILLTDAGHPVLLDFGAARRVIGDRSHAITAIVKPNFAPIEQYADVAAVRQGPWTDLYALAATIYYLLTGQPPLPAAARALHDELVPLARLQPADCSLEFLQAIDWAMGVRPKDRPQSLALWRDVLEGRMAVPSRVRADVTLPNVAAMGTRAPGGQVLDFDPTRPWQSGLDASTAAAVSNAVGQRAADGRREQGAAVEPAAVDTQPASPADFVDTRPEPMPTAVAPVQGRRARRWTLVVAGASVVMLVAVLGWRAASTPAVPPVQTAASAASTDGAASAGSATLAASGVVTDTHAAGTAGSGTPAARAPVGPSATDAPVPIVAPGEVLLTAPPGVTAATAAPGGTERGDTSVPRTLRIREREPEADTRARGRERERDRASDSATARPVAVIAPSARCADKNFLLRPICMKRACDADPRLRGHPECVSMQQAEQERRDVMLHR